MDQLVFHAIHIEVIRLSRHFNALYPDSEEYREHLRRLERILALIAQYRGANGYNQGYHELLAFLYYAAMKDRVELDLAVEKCEAVAYFMLHGLAKQQLLMTSS
jgi:hypothetical protein